MSPIALRKQLSKQGTLLAAGKLAESSRGGWEVLSEAQKMDGACYTPRLMHKWNLAHSNWPFFKGGIDR